MATTVKKIDIILLGDGKVGKTTLINRYLYDEFINIDSTQGVELYSQKLSFHGNTVDFKIYDTAGQKNYQSITQNFLKNGEGVMIVFSLEDYHYQDTIEHWMNMVQENGQRNASMILVGTKSDLIDTRMVKSEEAKKFAERHGLHYIEVSAKDNINVQVPFHTLGWLVYDKKKNNDNNNNNNIVLGQNVQQANLHKLQCCGK